MVVRKLKTGGGRLQAVNIATRQEPGFKAQVQIGPGYAHYWKERASPSYRVPPGRATQEGTRGQFHQVPWPQCFAPSQQKQGTTYLDYQPTCTCLPTQYTLPYLPSQLDFCAPDGSGSNSNNNPVRRSFSSFPFFCTSKMKRLQSLKQQELKQVSAVSVILP